MSESNHIPSIFNDVLGPVMRGPSSSHSAAANRIGRLCRDLVEGDLRSAVIEYDPNGSLVTTHKSQGTDMGLYGGFSKNPAVTFVQLRATLSSATML